VTKRLLTAIFACLACAGAAAQPAFPDHPLRLVIGFPPGTATDIASRIIARKMSELLGQQMVVDNRPGASTGIAAMAVAGAAPDGYTLFMAGNSNAVAPSLQKSAQVDFFRDFAPIGLAVSVPSILVINPALGVSDVPELARLVKNKPGQIFFASSGDGTMSHLAGELFAYSLGSRMIHVPYKGSAQALTDLLAGTVPVMFAPASTVLPYIKEGRLKALATTGAERSKIAPDLPTIAEKGIPDYDTRIWFGMVAPARTPDAVIRKLADNLTIVLDSLDVKEQLAAQGMEPFRGDAAKFTAHMQREMTRWSAVIKSRGITAD